MARPRQPSGLHIWDGEKWALDRGAYLERMKMAKREEMAAARYEAETSGVLVGGVIVKTDRESQALITGAALQAMADSEYSCQWKAEQGFITLTAEQIQGVAVAVRMHVQACFDREAELVELIDQAQTPEELEAITWEEGGDPVEQDPAEEG